MANRFSRVDIYRKGTILAFNPTENGTTDRCSDRSAVVECGCMRGIGGFVGKLQVLAVSSRPFTSNNEQVLTTVVVEKLLAEPQRRANKDLNPP